MQIRDVEINLKVIQEPLVNLRASSTVSVELKCPVELNSLSDVSRSANQRTKACS